MRASPSSGWGHRPSARRRPPAKAGRIIAIDINEQVRVCLRKLGATDRINPNTFDKPIQEVIVEMTDGGVDFSFECIGNVKGCARRWSAGQGWGESVIIGVAGAGQEISTRPFQLVTGGCGAADAFGGCAVAANCRAMCSAT